MKTTLDLPSDLVHALKLHALHEGRKIKDVVAAFIASGLAAQAPKSKPEKGHLTFPLFPCGPKAPASTMTTEQILAAEQAILTQQDLDYYTPPH